MPDASLHAITCHQHQATGLPASLLAYLPQWFNHIDLKANREIYVKVPAWLTGQLGAPPG
jgi:hypothetical protein